MTSALVPKLVQLSESTRCQSHVNLDARLTSPSILVCGCSATKKKRGKRTLACSLMSASTEVPLIPSMSSLLSQLGFAPGEIVEVILTTVGVDGLPNAAPMGVWVHQDWSLALRPFRDTLTARNLTKVPEAVINITNDPYVFFRTAFKEEAPVGEELSFENAKSVKAPRLRGMLGYIEVSLKPSGSQQATSAPKSESEVAEFECSVRKVDAAARPPTVHSRARCAAIEAVIDATRIRALHTVDPAKSKQLLARIQECRSLAQRVAPGSAHAKVVEETLQLVQRWMTT